MLKIVLPASDEEPAVKLKLEHSLVAIFNWEGLYKKPFFGRDGKTPEETAHYIEMMILGDPPDDVMGRLTPEQFRTIAEYINDSNTATTFREDPTSKPSFEVVTSELVYYWMTQFKIPFKPTDEWHFNRLMTLIQIAGIKQSKPKKMSKQAMAEQYRKLNAQRREQLGTTG